MICATSIPLKFDTVNLKNDTKHEKTVIDLRPHLNTRNHHIHHVTYKKEGKALNFEKFMISFLESRYFMPNSNFKYFFVVKMKLINHRILKIDLIYDPLCKTEASSKYNSWILWQKNYFTCNKRRILLYSKHDDVSYWNNLINISCFVNDLKID